MKTDLLFFGDICLDNEYRTLLTEDSGVFDAGICKMIADSAFVLANLECPLAEGETKIKKTGSNIKAKKQDIDYLKKVGLSALALANNHILDYGQKAVTNTIDYCNEKQLLCFGAGKNAQEAKKPLRIRVAEKNIIIFAFAEAEFNLAGERTAGANHFDVYTSLDDIRKAKEDSDYVVVLYHGGIEHYRYASPLLQKKCRAMVKAGADLVLCQHSHCIGTKEEYKGATILYGQGNTAFANKQGNVNWNEGLIVGVSLEERAVSLHLMQATPQGVILAGQQESNQRILQLEKDSENLQDAQFLNREWRCYCAKQEAMDLALLYGKNRVYNKLNRLLHNALINIFYKGKKQMITMNLIRCEAHHEVVQTILENNFFND